MVWASRIAVLSMYVWLGGCADFEIEVDLDPKSTPDAGQVADAVGTDGGGISDAGSAADLDSVPDAGSDPGGPDQAALINDSCAAAIEASGGGNFSGDTCLATDTADFSCGEDGRPEVFYSISVPAGEWSCWVKYFNEGLTVAYSIMDGDQCPDQPGFCIGPTAEDPTGEGGILFGGGQHGQTYWMAVEATGNGDCGFYTFTVECHDLH